MSEMKRAARMCKSCPFRDIQEAERYELAVVDPDAWPCHTEPPMGWGDTHCRGHYEARRKYPPSLYEVQRLHEWQASLCKLMAQGVPVGELPEAPLRNPMPKKLSYRKLKYKLDTG